MGAAGGELRFPWNKLEPRSYEDKNPLTYQLMSATSGHRVDVIEQGPSWRVSLKGRAREDARESERKGGRESERDRERACEQKRPE